MPVSTTNAISGPMTTNGIATIFPFTFTAPSDVEVQVLSRDIATGVLTVIDPANYTVARNIGSGGSVTFDAAPAAGAEIYPKLDPLFTQDIEFTSGAKITATALNRIADRAAARDQLLWHEVGRAIRANDGEAGLTLRPRAELAGKALFVSDDGEEVGGEEVLAVVQGVASAVTEDAAQIRDEAVDAADRAAADADVAAISAALLQALGAGVIYDTAAQGVSVEAGVAPGEYFMAWEGQRLRAYLNEAGVAVEKVEFVTAATLGDEGAGLIGFEGTSATKVTQTLAVHIRECEVRVTQEGALGNAAANDATAIQNAIAEAEIIAAAKGGCDVIFPPGAYRINSGLRVRRDRINLIFRGGAKLLPFGSFDTLTFQSASAATFIYQNNLVAALFEETNKTGGKALVGKYLAESVLELTTAGGFDGIQLDTFNTVDLTARLTGLTSASAIHCLVRGGGSVGARSDVLRIHKMVMGGNYVPGQTGLVIDGFVHTVIGKSVYGVNVGGRVLVTQNTISAADNPAFLNFWDFQTDFQRDEAIFLAEGQIAEFQGAICNGSRASSNIFVGSSFKDARFIGGRSTGAALAGIAIAGTDTAVIGMKCMSNSSNQYTGTLNTFPGIVVGGASSGTRILGCRSGDLTTPTFQSSGIQIDTGATNFIVKDNDVRGNVASGVVNGAGTSASKIVDDNII
jgi:hypothetical protein